MRELYGAMAMRKTLSTMIPLALLLLTGPSDVTAHTSAAAGANVTPGELVIDPPSTSPYYGPARDGV